MNALAMSGKPISIKALEENSENALKTLSDRLQVYGYCELAFGDSSLATIVDNLVEQMEAFFTQPIAQKKALSMSENAGLRGYVAVGEEITNGTPDIKESFEVAHEDIHKYLAPPYDVLTVPNIWPESETLPDFRQCMEHYMQATNRLSEIIFDAMVSALMRSKTKRSCLALREGDPCKYSRLIHFSAWHPGEEIRNPLVEHTDHSFFTISFQTSLGLEIKRQDKKWVPWSLQHDRFLVFTGEIAETWSGGVYQATPHRVRQSLISKERLAIATFVLPDLTARILPLTENGTKLNLDIAPYQLLDEEYKRMQQIFSKSGC